MLVLTRRREEAESEESYGSESCVFWEAVGLDFCMCDLFRSFRSVTRRGGTCMDGRTGPPRPIVDALDAGAKKGTRRE